MSGISMYSMTEAELTASANQVKECVIRALDTEGLLNGDVEKISENLVVVAHSKGFFGAIWDKARGVTNKDSLYYSVFKSVNENS